MEKSKLGISITLFSALLYFLGASGSVLVIAIAAGYVLLVEDSEVLKKTAVKALILTMILALLSAVITFLTMLLSSVLGTIDMYLLHKRYATENYTYTPTLYQTIQFLPNIINNIVNIIEIVIPVIFGLRAYKQRDIKIKLIDKILDKHFG